MSEIVLKEPYTHVLEYLGDVQQVADEALRQYAIRKAEQQVLELQEKVRAWEDKYDCSYDLFAYRTATDEEYVRQLDSNPESLEWEADLFSWEFYATELKEWRERLHSISNTWSDSSSLRLNTFTSWTATRSQLVPAWN